MVLPDTKLKLKIWLLGSLRKRHIISRRRKKSKFDVTCLAVLRDT